MPWLCSALVPTGDFPLSTIIAIAGGVGGSRYAVDHRMSQILALGNEGYKHQPQSVRGCSVPSLGGVCGSAPPSG